MRKLTGVALWLMAFSVWGAELAATGSVVADRRVTLSAKITGRIVEVAVEEGQAVKAGEVLIAMDDAELKAQLARARAALGLARVDRDHATKLDARVQRLSEQKTVSEDVADEARHGKLAAEQRVLIAQADEARMEALVDEMRIAAPFDAVVTAKLGELGQLASPGEPLLIVEDHRELKFRATVNEQDIVSIELGQKARVRIDALATEVAGVVSTIVPSGDESHGFVVEVALDPLPRLYPGMFGKAQFGH